MNEGHDSILLFAAWNYFLESPGLIADFISQKVIAVFTLEAYILKRKEINKINVLIQMQVCKHGAFETKLGKMCVFKHLSICIILYMFEHIYLLTMIVKGSPSNFVCVLLL